MNNNQKVLFITIIGSPNVGKSSLINHITQMPYCTVSSKGHTTKTSIYSILNIENTQLIFIDTPGLSQENTSMYGKLNQIAQNECNIDNSNHIILFLFEADKKIPSHVEYLLHKYQNKQKIAVMTKFDKKHHNQYLYNTDQIKDLVDDVFITSIINNKGIDTLLQYLIQNAKEMEWPYSSSFKTNISQTTLIKNLIREACFEHLYYEIPHEVIIDYTITNDRCDVNLHIKESQKHIVLSKIKEISMLSRQKVQKILNIKSLYVKVHILS